MATTLPKICHHKILERGYFKFKGKRYYIPGKWPKDIEAPSQEIKAAYFQALTKLLEGDQKKEGPPEGITICELVSQYLDGIQNEETPHTVTIMKGVSKHLIRHHGMLAAKDFGPILLEEFRQKLLESGYDRVKPSTGEISHHEYTRSGLNYIVKRVRKIFRWGVRRELIPDSVLNKLLAIPALRQGRTKAPEAKDIPEVPDEVIAQTLPFLSPPIAAMVRLQRLAAMRPGEVCGLSMPEIDRADPECWVYAPKEHKTAHKDKHRVIVFGSEAQSVLAPWLREDDKPLFSPAEWMAERKRLLRANRKSPVQPSQASRAKANPVRAPGESYTTYSYGRAIAKACKANGIPQWSPNQVRKRAAQWILEQEGHGIEDAAAVLGNDPKVARAHYLRGQTQRAKKVILRAERGAAAKKSPPTEIPSPPGGNS